jgi:hypothetical protein
MEDTYEPDPEREMSRHREMPGFKEEMAAAVQRAREASPEAISIEEFNLVWIEALSQARTRESKQADLS